AVVTTTSQAAGATVNLYAAGYDTFGNYIADQLAAWTSTGLYTNNTLVQGTVSPFAFTATNKTSSGTLTATFSGKTANVNPVTITAANASSIVFRDSPNGAGNIINSMNLITGVTNELFSAGYDTYGNYVGDPMLYWYFTNTVAQVVASPITPTNHIKIRGFSSTSGYLFGTNLIGIAISNEMALATYFGSAAGLIDLLPTPSTVIVGSTTITMITSSIVTDLAGNPVTNADFTVIAGNGALITNTDANGVIPGMQVKSDNAGKVIFGVTNWLTVGSVSVSANSIVGAASGNSNITVQPGVEVHSISSFMPNYNRVSRGQTGILVSVIITNRSGSAFTISSSSLIFKSGGTTVALSSAPQYFTAAVPANSAVSNTFTVDIPAGYAYPSVIVYATVGGLFGASPVSINSETQSTPRSDTWVVEDNAVMTAGLTVPNYFIRDVPFDIVATVSNTGGSKLSNVVVELFSFVPASFALSMITTNSVPPAVPVHILPGASAQFIWNFTVTNDNPMGLPLDFTVRMAGIDANSLISNSSGNVTARVESGSTNNIKAVITRSDIGRKTAVAGQTIRLYTLVISNNAGAGPNLFLSNATFAVQDAAGSTLTAANALQQVYMTTNGVTIATHSVTAGDGSSIAFLGMAVALDANTNTYVDVMGVIAASPGVNGFKLSLPDTAALTITIGASGPPTTIVDENGRALTACDSSIIGIRSRDFAQSLSSAPNPFNPAVLPALISFYLDAAETVNIDIYTLTGERVMALVRDTAYTAGMNSVLWNGRNGAGKMVISGVYLCVIRTSSGRTGTLKVAVMR
ncbi:MAG: hypothetical protein AABZ39_17205, partial [Spirochaetota bacterium]